MQDTDIESAEAAALAAQAAHLLTSAHAAAVEASNQFSDDQDQDLGQHLCIAPFPVGMCLLKTCLHTCMLLAASGVGCC